MPPVPPFSSAAAAEPAAIRSAMEHRMREKVEKALEKVRPYLRGDGGDVELVEITPDGIIRLRLTGACKNCPMAGQTMSQGVERVIRKEVPGARGVETVSY